ncbi:hypothetical protein [Rhodococcus koreensis]
MLVRSDGLFGWHAAAPDDPEAAFREAMRTICGSPVTAPTAREFAGEASR